MKIGMLWLETEKTTDLFATVRNAAKYYQGKYGQVPNLCFVHPTLMAKLNQVVEDSKIAIKPDKTILPGCLWIGVDEKLPSGAD